MMGCDARRLELMSSTRLPDRQGIWQMNEGKMTEPQIGFLKWMASHNGRCVMARYDKPMFGDYGPTIRRLLRRGMIIRTCSPNGFPFLHLTETGRRAVSFTNGDGK